MDTARKRKIARYATNQTAIVVASTVITKTVHALFPGTLAYPKATGLAGGIAGFVVADYFEDETDQLADYIVDKLESRSRQNP